MPDKFKFKVSLFKTYLLIYDHFCIRKAKWAERLLYVIRRGGR